MRVHMCVSVFWKLTFSHMVLNIMCVHMCVSVFWKLTFSHMVLNIFKTMCEKVSFQNTLTHICTHIINYGYGYFTTSACMVKMWYYIQINVIIIEIFNGFVEISLCKSLI